MADQDFLALIVAAADVNDICRDRFFDFQCGTDSAEIAQCFCSQRRDFSDVGRSPLSDWIRSEHPGVFEVIGGRRLPDWVREGQDLLTSLRCLESSRGGTLLQRLARPATRHARRKLVRRLKRRNVYSLPPAVIDDFERHLEQTLIMSMGSAVELQFKAFVTAIRCLSPGLQALSRTELEQEFIGQNAGERVIALFQSWPALLKIWAQLIRDWADKIVEMATRLRADHAAIRGTLFRGRDPGALTGVVARISDPHHGGRDTLILRFENGSVVYKPRSGRSEMEWYSFIRWANRRRFRPRLKVLNLIPRHDYSWHEFVAHTACRPEDVYRYFRRAGGLLCGAFFLGATDLHCGNLIAARDQPVLIDAETLFHPRTDAGNALDSLSRIGFLPAVDVRSRANTDISLLGKNRGEHSPLLTDESVFASSYVGEVAEGFEEMWHLIGDYESPAAAAFRRRLRKAAQSPWRRLHFSTGNYLEIRERSFAPDALRSGLLRSQVIARGLQRRGVSGSILVAEVKAITRCDIPHFVATGQLPETPASGLPELLAQIECALTERRSAGAAA